MSSRTQSDLEERLEEVSSLVETAKKAVLIEAPQLASTHLRHALETAQGKLMEADDLARIHVRELEARLEQK